MDLTKEQDVEQPAAACLLVRRSAIGPELFDERFPLFFNDVDLCHRLGAHGRCRYLPHLTAVHQAAGSITAGRRAGVPVNRLYEDGLLAYADKQLPGSGWLRWVVAARRRAMRRAHS